MSNKSSPHHFVLKQINDNAVFHKSLHQIPYILMQYMCRCVKAGVCVDSLEWITDLFLGKHLKFPLMLHMKELKPGAVNHLCKVTRDKTTTQIFWFLQIEVDFCHVHDHEMLFISCVQENFILAIHRIQYKYRIVQKVSSPPVKLQDVSKNVHTIQQL